MMSVAIEVDMEGNRTSKIIPGYEDTKVEGLQYRRGSRKMSLPLINDMKSFKMEASDESEENGEHEELIPYAPDGGYGWVIVLASFLCNFVLDGICLSQSALMEDIRKASGIINATHVETNFTESSINSTSPENINDEPEYEITVARYGLISAVLLCVTLSVGPFISILTDRYGFRIVSMAGSILASLGIFLSVAVSPYTPNIWAFVVFFGGLSGIGYGMMFQPSIVIVGIYFEKWRPLATGIAIAGTGAGTFAFPPLLATISKVTGSKYSAYIGGGYLPKVDE